MGSCISKFFCCGCCHKSPSYGLYDKFDIIIVAGQSNATGYQIDNYLPSNYYFVNRGGFESSGNFDEKLSNNIIIPKSVSDNPPYELCNGNLNIGTICAYNYYMNDYPYPICVVNGAVSGSNIDKWNPNDKKSYFHKLISQIKFITKDRNDIDIIGVLWAQGETNATKDQDYDYENKLSEVLKGFRSNLRDDLPIIMGELSGPAKYKKGKDGKLIFPNYDTINEAIRNVVDNTKFTRLVSTYGLKTSDEIHYLPSNVFTYGTRFYEEIKNICENHTKLDTH